MWGRGCIWIKKEQNPKDLKKSGYWGYFMTQTCRTFPARGGPGCISPRILPSSVLSAWVYLSEDPAFICAAMGC